MPESSQKSEVRESLVKYAGRILAGRPYFRSKLKDKLYLRAEKLQLTGFEPVIDSIIADLEKSGYLNDAYLAEAYVRRQLSKGYGPKIIFLKLKYLGLDSGTIKRAMETEADEQAEISSIEAYCRKFGHLDKPKLISKLYSRGYSGSIIGKVLQYNY